MSDCPYLENESPGWSVADHGPVRLSLMAELVLRPLLRRSACREATDRSLRLCTCLVYHAGCLLWNVENVKYL